MQAADADSVQTKSTGPLESDKNAFGGITSPARAELGTTTRMTPIHLRSSPGDR
jgi:hypothetical protein